MRYAKQNCTECDMNKITHSICVFMLLLFVFPFDVSAQDSLKVKVSEIGTPQYFAVFVTDLARSIEWYKNTLALQEMGGSEDENGAWEIMNLGNDRLTVELIRDDRAIAVDRAIGFFKVGFQVPDVRLIASRFAESRRPRVLEFARFGIRIIQLHDPDGNTIQLSSPLGE